MVNPIAQAYAEKSPVVVLSGSPGVKERQTRDLLHHKVKTFDSQRRIYEEVTIYASTLDNPVTADEEIHRAINHALTFKRPVYLEIPRDMVYAEIQEASHRSLLVKKTDQSTLLEALEETCQILNRAVSPVILVGVEVGRFNLQDIVVNLAENLGVPVCCTMLGKSAFPEGHPQYVGIYNGEAGNQFVRNLIEESDCLLMLGVFMTDINLGMFTAHLDPACTLSATSERIAIKHHEYHNVLFEDFIRALSGIRDLPHYNPNEIVPVQSRLVRGNGSISMNSLLYELNQFVNENIILLAEPGDPMFAADDLQMREGTSFLCPAYYVSMGFAVPGVIGTQLADPFRRPIALVGDGAFQMTGMEIITAKRLGLNPIVIVTNNGSFATLRAMGHQEADFVNIPKLDYAQLAKVLGGNGFTINNCAQLRNALYEAQESDTFSILDVQLSPDDISPGLQHVCDWFSKSLQG